MATQDRAALYSVLTSYKRVTKIDSSTVLEQELGTLPILHDAPRRRAEALARLPLCGITALIGVLLFLVLSILVLVLSNNKSQTPIYGEHPWPKAVGPNVLVSIFNNAANMCFGVAISKTSPWDVVHSSY